MKLSRGQRLIFGAGAALYVSSFVPRWGSIERAALSVSVTESGNAFQAYGFFPVEVGLVVAILATGFAIAKLLGFKWQLDQLTLGLCAFSFVLLSIGVVRGPEADPSSVAVGTIEAHRGVLSFVGIVLAGLMTWGAWEDERTEPSAAAKARE